MHRPAGAGRRRIVVLEDDDLIRRHAGQVVPAVLQEPLARVLSEDEPVDHALQDAAPGVTEPDRRRNLGGAVG